MAIKADSLPASELSLSGVGSIPVSGAGVPYSKLRDRGEPPSKSKSKSKPVHVAKDAFKKAGNIGEQEKTAAQGKKTGYEPEALDRMQEVADQQQAQQSGLLEPHAADRSIPARVGDPEESHVENQEVSGHDSGVYAVSEDGEPERTGLVAHEAISEVPRPKRRAVIPENPDFLALVTGRCAVSYAHGSGFGSKEVKYSRRWYIPTPFPNGDTCANTTMSGRRLQFAADDQPFSPQCQFEHANTTIAQEDWNRMRDQMTLARLNAGGLLPEGLAQGWKSMTA
ncbi:MAG: hypothetical protein IPK13_05835 [Deltaproteobacteria bacterium]|nr:hypothetical protein [Deltaproteobacteria bacterium]